MGKKKRLNRFIRKWIKSDLPDDCSTVLLLGVTRIPTTPTPARRPSSLALQTDPPPVNKLSNPTVHHHKVHKKSSIKNCLFRQNSLTKTKTCSELKNCDRSDDFKLNKHFASQNINSSNLDLFGVSPSNASSSSNDVTPSNASSLTVTPGPDMDRSVDSIGACSLDVEASVDMTDCLSEPSSIGTLRSASLLPTPEPQPHLPSYLSLACTVSGYSTTTNYDPERLSRSRDASPHRLNDDINFFTAPNKNTSLYSVRNNLLSPPNLVPLPVTPETPKNYIGMDKQIITRREFYSEKSSGTSFVSKENKSFEETNIYSRDSVDGCIKVNRIQSKCINLERKNAKYNGNGSSKIESAYKQLSNGNEYENKSFIQQRVERLYGPGALAQGFFITKRLQNITLGDSDSDTSKIVKNDKFFNSKPNKLLDCEVAHNLKQSTSSPTLPVLRHLRPEFRAQLPIVNHKRNCENVLPKSPTIPVLKVSSTKVNGHSNTEHASDIHLNGVENKDVVLEDDGVKDGHYFLKIIEKETNRLLLLAEQVENELHRDGLTEDVIGKIRSAAGKAKLLASQKMQQFKGLCTKNITQVTGEAFPTTNEDLEGFWDMVMLQVDQVDALFKEIETIRANGWKDIPENVIVKTVSKTRRSATKIRPSTARNDEARKKREIERKEMIEQRRRAAKEQKKDDSIQIYVPESS